PWTSSTARSRPCGSSATRTSSATSSHTGAGCSVRPGMSIRQAPSIAATRWRIDPARSSVEFRVKNFWNLVTVKGGFSRYHGPLDLQADPAIDLTIEADSLDSRNERRDKHLRSGDFFDVDEHPYVRFVSNSAVLDGETLTVKGRLHARGESIPLT